MDNCSKQIRIVLEGMGFKYSVFEVPCQDVAVFTDTDHGVLLRNCFRRYIKEDMQRVQQGLPSRMISFYTLVDDPACPPEVTVSDGSTVSSHRLDNLTQWRFLVSDVQQRRFVEHMPEGMPDLYLKRIHRLLREYIDAIDEINADVLNGEYITFFNLYTPDGRMLLCMRSHEVVRSVFDVSVPARQDADIDRLCILCRDAQDVVVTDTRRCEYDANSLVYDSRWQQGTASSHGRSSADYFVYPDNPAVLDARWFESWAV